MAHFGLPAAEKNIIWRYFDGVSQALSRRLTTGSPVAEENITFLLCELLDEGMTGYHVLEYPLTKAKQDLATADGGLTLDISIQTHEHTKHVEHHFSGADLGLIFVVEHPIFGRSERAVLLQAKRLFPMATTKKFTLGSTFNSFHADQFEVLSEVEYRFKTWSSIFYLWYTPASPAFPDDDAKTIRSLEATQTCDWEGLLGIDPYRDRLIDHSWMSEHNRLTTPIPAEIIGAQQKWRAAQPGTRVSGLRAIRVLMETKPKPKAISLISLYKLRHGRARWRDLVFEPLADMFLAALLSERVGNSSKDWIRLARGEKIPMPTIDPAERSKRAVPELPDNVPTPRHTLTFTIRSTLREGL